MTRIILTFFSFLILSSISYGQTVYYLKYDEGCMNRLEYASGNEPAAYVSYRFALGDDKHVQLDVGKEAAKWVRDLPGKAINCDDIVVDKSLVRKINVGQVKIYMIRESPTHYNVSAVDKAVYSDSYPGGVEVIMDDAEFILDMSNLVSNQNIAKPSSPMAVAIDGTIQYQCLKGYILKKMENLNKAAYKEYILIPEIGIVEKRAIKARGTATGTLKLAKVGEQDFGQTVTQVCDGLQASFYDGQQDRIITSPAQKEAMTAKNVKPDPVPASYEETPCGTLTGGYHFVQKGETLYSISRRYGISLDQLRSWNGLSSSNVIRVCQKLRVADQMQSKGGNPTGSIFNDGDGAEQYVDVHIVRPGESVAMLSQMFGFTEERFRQMNNLDPFERVFPGQGLRTSDCPRPSDGSVTAGKPMPYDQTTERLTAKGNPDVYFRPVKVHQVGKSETLFSIAKQYDTTVDRVRELNGLTSKSKLVVGQRVYVQ